MIYHQLQGNNIGLWSPLRGLRHCFKAQTGLVTDLDLTTKVLTGLNCPKILNPGSPGQTREPDLILVVKNQLSTNWYVYV